MKFLFLKNLGIPLSTGQNLAIDYENWTEVITDWIEEKEHYYHVYPSTNTFTRYSQVITITKKDYLKVYSFR